MATEKDKFRPTPLKPALIGLKPQSKRGPKPDWTDVLLCHEMRAAGVKPQAEIAHRLNLMRSSNRDERYVRRCLRRNLEDAEPGPLNLRYIIPNPDAKLLSWLNYRLEIGSVAEGRVVLSYERRSPAPDEMRAIDHEWDNWWTTRPRERLE